MNVWDFLALGDSELERADLVSLNLAVAREIPSLVNLEIARFARIVDQWTEQFRQQLPQMERMFAATPWKWKNDVRFFRFGMLQGFLGHEIGIRYIEDQKHVASIRYTDPGQLFLHGLIDKKEGTCGNMAALHVAMCRRMGWPVSLASVRAHFISRYDDGEVIHNIEATSTHPGAFCSDPDEAYIKRFNLPERAILCGSDLRRLTMREMAGVFVALRGRYYADIGEMEQADLSYSLARVLFPQHRNTYLASKSPMLSRGRKLFDMGERGYPESYAQDVGSTFAPLLSPVAGAGMDVQVVSQEDSEKPSPNMHVVQISI